MRTAFTPTVSALLATALAAGCGARGGNASAPFDLLIVNGRIVDGTGNPWYRGDVGVRGGRIAEIGRLDGQPAARRIDAGDRVVAPGFIDMMAGTTVPLVVDPPSAESKLRQGVTTILVGEGGSVAPQNDFTSKTPAEDEEGLPITWKTFAQYFAILEQHG